MVLLPGSITDRDNQGKITATLENWIYLYRFCEVSLPITGLCEFSLPITGVVRLVG